MKKKHHKIEIKRINGHLNELISVYDEKGDVQARSLQSIMVEIKPKDIFQIFVGTLLVSSSLCFTEEIWTLSETLPIKNILFIFLSSFAMLTGYIYFNFYKKRLKTYYLQFILRIFLTYIIVIGSVSFILFLIDKFSFDSPWVSLKRVLLISFPALFGAVLSDQVR